MKKTLSAILVCTILSGCWYQTDYSKENAENRALKRAVEGCQMGDDHAAYRECMIQTQLKNSPKTYTTSQLPNGEPLAIIRDKDVSANEQEIVVVEQIETLTPTESEVVEPTPQKAEKTWWETYQDNKPVPQPVSCSCDDPNVSCPHCYEK